MKNNRNQVVMPINLEIRIPEDDPVRLVDEICEDLDYEKVYAAYERTWRKVCPETMLKIIIYGYMNGIYSGRSIESACRRDICFIWLLNGEPVPDHTTISRFQNGKLSGAIEDLFYQFIMKLHKMGEVDFENVFIDGTKIEANANRYTFVWRTAVEKLSAKLEEKLTGYTNALKAAYSLPQHISPEECGLRLREQAMAIDLVFRQGKGSRKTPLQRDIERLTELLERKYKYIEYLSVFQGRKSFSKTDREATFMRMKEDHMKNGQLKAGYNVQIGVENEYIIGVSLFPNPTDVNTLIPFLERFRKQTGRIVKNVIADAGYESEENYRYLKEKGQTPYIKPQNYEFAKTRKYQQDIYRVEHMTYDEENDLYICPDGRSLEYQYTRNSVSANGYDIHKRVYQNESCAGCPHRDKCHKSKYDRREIKVSQPFDELRRESYDNIVSEKGILLRMNRSIQVEGAFGVIKQDMSFRRFLTRGKQKTETQFFLIAISFNIRKLWNRRQADRTGMKLFHEEAA